MLVPPASQDAQVINDLYLLLYVLSAVVVFQVDFLIVFLGLSWLGFPLKLKFDFKKVRIKAFF